MDDEVFVLERKESNSNPEIPPSQLAMVQAEVPTWNQMYQNGDGVKSTSMRMLHMMVCYSVDDDELVDCVELESDKVILAIKIDYSMS